MRLSNQIAAGECPMHTTAGVVAIVEDDAAMRRSIERLLQASEYATVAFATCGGISAQRGVEASCAWASSSTFTSGACRDSSCAATSMRRRSKVPVVFITAHDDEATRAEAIALGCVEYLHKPFDASRLTAGAASGRMKS